MDAHEREELGEAGEATRSIDPMAELQHRHRQLVHDAKGSLVILKRTIELAKKRPAERSPHENLTLVQGLRSLEQSLVGLVQQLEPEFEARQLEPWPHQETASTSDASGETSAP